MKGKATTIICCFSIDLLALGNSLQDVLTLLLKSMFLILQLGDNQKILPQDCR